MLSHRETFFVGCARCFEIEILALKSVDNAEGLMRQPSRIRICDKDIAKVQHSKDLPEFAGCQHPGRRQL